MNNFKRALKLYLFCLILTGILYPPFVTLVAQIFFPKQANGSLIIVNGKPIGSKHIGQAFSLARLFSWQTFGMRL
jgi:K+-transporting ATPase ATPase C chain